MEMKHVIKAGDTLFSVDPYSLIIIKAKIIEVNDGYASIKREVKRLHERIKSIVRVAIDKFPIEYGGCFFFEKEEDAQNFIKSQIGL